MSFIIDSYKFGGGAPPNVFPTISNLHSRHRALSSSLFDSQVGGSFSTSGGVIGRWEDISGNNRHISTAISAERPIRILSGYGSFDVVRFNGTNNYLYNVAYGLTGTNIGITSFMVYKIGATNQSFARGISFSDPSTADFSVSPNFMGLVRNSATSDWGMYANGVVQLTRTMSIGNWQRAVSQRGFSNTWMSTNGVYHNGAPSAGGTFSPNFTRMGIGGLSAGTTPFGGDIVELIVYARALTMSEILSVETYIFNEYGGSAPFSTPVSPKVLTYTANGEGDGLIYLLGTAFYTAFFTNPHTLGSITNVQSTAGSGAITELTNRASGAFFTNNVAPSWVGLDIGSGRTLLCNHYAFRNRNGTGSAPNTWKLQGSNNVLVNTAAGFNAATWVDLDSQVNNTSAAGADAWFHGVATGVVAYRWFRIFQPAGGNSAGNDFLTIAEFDFWGTFTF